MIICYGICTFHEMLYRKHAVHNSSAYSDSESETGMSS